MARIYSINLDERQHAAVLAGLRKLQTAYSRKEVEDIMTDCGRIPALEHSEIDELCQQINMDGHVTCPPQTKNR